MSSRVGYRGTRDLIFTIGNLFIDANRTEPTPDTWRRAKPSRHDRHDPCDGDSIHTARQLTLTAQEAV